MLLHWSAGGDEAIESLEVATADYTTDDSSVNSGFKDLRGFIAAISPGLDRELQVHRFAGCGPSALSTAGSRPVSCRSQRLRVPRRRARRSVARHRAWTRSQTPSSRTALAHTQTRETGVTFTRKARTGGLH